MNKIMKNRDYTNFSLGRFLEAQKETYKIALAEIKSGRKLSHWMWFIFPQIAGLGRSYMDSVYSIKSFAEAESYIQHPVLRSRLVEISSALLELESSDPVGVMGFPDDMKLKSSMTLFEKASPDLDVFSKVLEKFYAGERDEKTLDIISTEVEKKVFHIQ
jgi:uncharacterized protein (DUF1810 family)